MHAEIIKYCLTLVLALTALEAFAAKPSPAVKVEIEVTVYEDGKVKVRQASKPTKDSMKNTRKSKRDNVKKTGCCTDKSCDGCQSNEQQMTTERKKKFSKSTKKDAVNMISKSLMALDVNQDGRLNADEVAPRLRSPFSQVDRNGDGYLDAGEIRRQIRSKMQDK